MRGRLRLAVRVSADRPAGLAVWVLGRALAHCAGGTRGLRWESAGRPRPQAEAKPRERESDVTEQEYNEMQDRRTRATRAVGQAIREALEAAGYEAKDAPVMDGVLIGVTDPGDRETEMSVWVSVTE